jgi:tetratricopeptide (TPR) repeat protein
MANELEDEAKPDLLDRLEAALSSKPLDGFSWTIKRMPDETHGSVVLRSHYWGLRKVFDGWQLPRDAETGRFAGGLAEVEAHYAAVSRRFGYTVVPPENVMNGVGYQILGRPDIEGAIEVFRRNVSLYPNSANVYDSLAEAYENAGRLAEAAENYARAVENAKKNDDQRLDIFETNLERVRKAIAESEQG